MKNIRIRLPNDYMIQASDDMLAGKSFLTIEEYNKQILKVAVRQLIENYKLLETPRLNYKPPVYTRWQKVKYRLSDYKQRCKDIWTILRGKDIHEDCEY